MSVAILKTMNPRDVSRVLDRLGGLRRFVSRGDRVLVKPNICAPRSSASGAVTDPELVAELCRLVEECGGKPMVADSPIFPFPARAAFRIAGYADFPKKYGFPRGGDRCDGVPDHGDRPEEGAPHRSGGEA
jgi:uncharacterized protein (DUF362 family)